MKNRKQERFARRQRQYHQPSELAQVASLARRLLLGKTTLPIEFPEYQYGKADWLREQGAGQ